MSSAAEQAVPLTPEHEHGTSPDSTFTAASATAWLASLIHTPLRITLTDSRAFVGHFLCTDKQGNIILSQAEEMLPAGRSEEDAPIATGAWGGREMGMVMCPSGGVSRVEAQVSDGQWADLKAGKSLKRGT